MSSCVEQLQALCGDDEALYEKLKDSLLAQIVVKDNEDFYRLEPGQAIKFAMELECSSYIGSYSSRSKTYQQIKRSTSNLSLMRKLFGKPGIRMDRGDGQVVN